MSSSVLFDHRPSADAPIQIRGVSSLGYSSTAPLVTNLFQNVGYAESNGLGTKKANELANLYERNENKVMAYSFVMEALFETTETGELLTKTRGALVETYGDQQSKDASEIYSDAIDLIRGIKNEIPGGKMSDYFINVTAFGFGLKATYLQSVDGLIGLRVKILDEDVYNERILKIINYTGGGGGAGGGW